MYIIIEFMKFRITSVTPHDSVGDMQHLCEDHSAVTTESFDVK